MTSPHHHEYYESIGSARSPSGIQHQQSHPSLHRAQSRHFETFTAGGLYTAEDHAARYDTNRFESRLVSNYPYEASGAQTWNPSNFNAASMVGLGSATGRIKTPSRQRAALPSTWMEQASTLPTVTPLPGLGNVPLGTSPMRTETVNSDPDEELIPTAIVIKNIPFAVKKEQLVQLMTELQLPLPYAFNYHFDNGVFRGLAFANFTTPEETAMVIEALNHFDLQGRKLRVEYKKMLPLQERERIEREKRERRGQLEEQHRPVPVNQLTQPSILPATSPTPSTARVKPGTILKSWSSMMELGYNANVVSNQKMSTDVDLNDPQTLQFYSQLLLFRDDVSREALIFPPTLTPQQRRTVHTLAHHMGLAHVSRGTGEQRQVQVFRAATNSASALGATTIPTVHPAESQQRRTLARATTMDFSDARSEGAGIYATIGRSAHALLDIPASPSTRNDLQSRQNLRAAKSFADLRSYTPSPGPSSTNFPATLSAGISRYTSDYGSVSTATPSLTPTTTGNSMSPSNPSESILVNGLAGVSLTTPLGGNLGIGASLREARDPRVALEREQRERERENQNTVGGGLSGSGTTRSYVGYNVDDSPTQQNNRGGPVIPLRQPRGPDSERGVGFGRNRQNHRRSSGELDVQSGVEIVVE
ncbi:hypothetical protein BDZ91DRAFT_762278 [Kalaharituber pfeilii]|nr:hypothetical protein BDZ91DRAFT_762278 [Kalaharituber pfeilii]